MKSTGYKVRVMEETASGKRGGVTLMLSGADFTAGPVRLLFRRWGYQKPFLHMQGWDIVEFWIDLPSSRTDAGALAMVLPSQLFSHLEENSNYVVTIVLPDGRKVEQAVRWSVANVKRAPLLTAHPEPSPVIATPLASTNDGAAWRVALELDSREAYETFLKSYPTSSHATAARAALDQRMAPARPTADAEEQAWLAALRSPSKIAWTAFLLAHPDGRYVEQAKMHLAAFLSGHLTVQARWPANGAVALYGVNLCAFLLTSSGQVRHDADFISSFATDQATGKSLQGTDCSSVHHLGTNLDRATNLRAESLAVNLDEVVHEIEAIAISISLDERAAVRLGLQAVNASVDLMDAARTNVIFSSPADTGDIGIKGRVALTLRRSGADWLLTQSTETFKDGIYGLCQRFGIVTD